MSFQGDSIFWVEVEKVVPNPYQPRREFDEEKLQELSESVRMYGILQPLTVTRKEIQGDDDSFFTEYELIAGERRLRAARLAGLSQVPVIIRDSDDSEQEKLELAIIENLQREDLNAVDRALAFRQLTDTSKMTHAEVAKKVGRSRMYVSNSIRLLGLPQTMLDSLKVGDISEGHARTLLMLNDRPEEQDVVYREILLKKLSVREVERIVRKIATDKTRKKTWKGTDPHLLEIEKEFTDVLGTRVFINKTDYGGKVTIDYFSEEDLQKLLLLVKQHPGVTESTEEDVSETVVTSMAALAAATPMVAAAEDTPRPEEQSTEVAPSPAPEPNPIQEPSPKAETETPEAADTQTDDNESEPHSNPSEPSVGAAPQPAHDPSVEQAVSAITTSTDALGDYVVERAEASQPPEAETEPSQPQEQPNGVPDNADGEVGTHAEANVPSPTEEPTNATTNKPTPPDDESDLYSVRGFSV